MEIKVIRTESEYHSYLEEVERLLSCGVRLTPTEGDRLEVLTVLIEAYENRKYPVEPPDPINAILFRMEERGLKQADLIPYFGSSSRVSEVLKRKRPLTVQMIRAVSLGLGISAEILVGLGESSFQKNDSIEWSKFPIKEIMKRGWLDKIINRNSESHEELIRDFISFSGLRFGEASFRRSLVGEAKSPTTLYALYAWLARVIQCAREKKKDLGSFDKTKLTASFLREVAQMSWSGHGPVLAIEYLQKHGISVVVESQLKGTQLDGAALKDTDGMPIIALTLRYDRLDNFWFTLLHEMVHIWKHVDMGMDAFVDDLNVLSEDRREAEANRLAGEAFIPRIIWRRSGAFISPSRETIEKLAKELRIHPAIIAGRIRKETGNFAIFNEIIGNNQVRCMFPLVR